MPGITIVSPMTPQEYILAYKDFMSSNKVFYVSEHRKSYDMKDEMPDIITSNPDITLFAISITRFSAVEVVQLAKKLNINVNVIHLFRIKPLCISKLATQSLATSKYGGIVLDDDYVDGIAKNIALDLSHLTNKYVDVLGLDDRTAGFHSEVDNLPPDANKILKLIIKIMKKS